MELRTCNRKSENEDQLSLLDFVVTTAVDKDPKALYFVEEMVGIEQACRLDLEYMKVTVSEFESSVAKLKILISEKMLPSLEEKLGQFSSVSCSLKISFAKRLMSLMLPLVASVCVFLYAFFTGS